MTNQIAGLLFFIASTLSCLFSNVAFADRGVGNGGDRIRMAFIEKGKEIVHYLEDSPAGWDLIQKHSIRPKNLLQFLDVDHIKVVLGPIQDNGGSLVDAALIGGVLCLDRDRWTDAFLNDPSVYHLVFHEMLRLSQVYPDDNYAISNELKALTAEQAHSQSSLVRRFGITSMLHPSHLELRKFVDFIDEKTRGQDSEVGFFSWQTLKIARDYNLFYSAKSLVPLLNGRVDMKDFRIDLALSDEEALVGALNRNLSISNYQSLVHYYGNNPKLDDARTQKTVNYLMPYTSEKEMDEGDMRIGLTDQEIQEIRNRTATLTRSRAFGIDLVTLSSDDPWLASIVFYDEANSEITLVGFGVDP